MAAPKEKVSPAYKKSVESLNTKREQKLLKLNFVKIFNHMNKKLNTLSFFPNLGYIGIMT